MFSSSMMDVWKLLALVIYSSKFTECQSIVFALLYDLSRKIQHANCSPAIMQFLIKSKYCWLRRYNDCAAIFQTVFWNVGLLCPRAQQLYRYNED
jgi:hypothetical protein